MKKILIFTYFLVSQVCYTYAQPGILDSSFGTNGIVITNYPAYFNEFSSSAVLYNDKLIVCSYVSNASISGTMLTRYLPDGTIDITFGSEGFSVLNLSLIHI